MQNQLCFVTIVCCRCCQPSLMHFRCEQWAYVLHHKFSFRSRSGCSPCIASFSFAFTLARRRVQMISNAIQQYRNNKGRSSSCVRATCSQACLCTTNFISSEQTNNSSLRCRIEGNKNTKWQQTPVDKSEQMNFPLAVWKDRAIE